MIVGMASANTTRKYRRGTGASPMLHGFLLLAATSTRLVLFQAKVKRKTKFWEAKKPVGDWPLELVTVDAFPLPATSKRAPATWAIVLTVPTEDTEIILDCARVPAVNELLVQVVAATGGTLADSSLP
jgi:hypothetical protein